MWIACSDRMPEHASIVFVWDAGWNSSYIAQLTDDGWAPGQHEPPEKQSDITHWMAFPAQPQPAEQKPGDLGNCNTCGMPLIWQNAERRVAMCPNCVMERCLRAELRLGWHPHPPARAKKKGGPVGKSKDKPAKEKKKPKKSA